MTLISLSLSGFIQLAMKDTVRYYSIDIHEGVFGHPCMILIIIDN